MAGPAASGEPGSTWGRWLENSPLCRSGQLLFRLPEERGRTEGWCRDKGGVDRREGRPDPVSGGGKGRGVVTRDRPQVLAIQSSG